MTGETRIPPKKITGLRGALVKRFSRSMLGEVPESAGVLWHHPAVFKDFMGIGRKAEKWGKVDPNLTTYAVMSAAATIGCHACLDINYFMTHHRGLDAVKAREVPGWRDSNVFTPLERQVLEYGEAMSHTPPAVTDEQSAALLETLGPAALLELTTRVALMNAMARANITLGIKSQGFSDSCGLPPLTDREGATTANT